MTDTPETDAAYKNHPRDMHDYIPLEFCRKLERERDLWKAEAERWKTISQTQTTQHDGNTN